MSLFFYDPINDEIHCENKDSLTYHHEDDGKISVKIVTETELSDEQRLRNLIKEIKENAPYVDIDWLNSLVGDADE